MEPAVTTDFGAQRRRLRVMEIAVLVDHDELSHACDRLCTALDQLSELDAPALPHAMSWYGAVEPPRSVQAEVLCEIDSGQTRVCHRCRSARAQRVGRVLIAGQHPHGNAVLTAAAVVLEQVWPRGWATDSSSAASTPRGICS
jgi:hypothetical protein